VADPILCKWGCGAASDSFREAVVHRASCPRLRNVGFDLELKVRAGKLSIEDAEAKQASRPQLRL
jgi:hypothetical protein